MWSVVLNSDTFQLPGRGEESSSSTNLLSALSTYLETCSPQPSAFVTAALAACLAHTPTAPHPDAPYLWRLRDLEPIPSYMCVLHCPPCRPHPHSSHGVYVCLMCARFADGSAWHWSVTQHTPRCLGPGLASAQRRWTRKGWLICWPKLARAQYPPRCSNTTPIAAHAGRRCIRQLEHPTVDKDRRHM
jgi:hypothetical protein